MTTVYTLISYHGDEACGTFSSSPIDYPIFSSMEKLREWFLENFFQLDLKNHHGYEFYFYAIPVDKPFALDDANSAVIVDSVIPGYEHPEWFMSEFDELGHRIDWEKV